MAFTINKSLLFLMISVVAIEHCVETQSDTSTLFFSSTSGDTLYLPCIDAPDEIIPIWSINGSLYPSTTISFFFANAHYRGQGILFTNVDINLSGVYVCYKRAGEDGYQLEDIITIYLNVKPLQDSHRITDQQLSTRKVFLDVLKIEYTKTETEFSWIIEGNNNVNDLTSVINVTNIENCDAGPIFNDETAEKNLAMPSAMFSNQSQYAELVIKYANGTEFIRLPSVFQIGELAKIEILTVYEGDTVCVLLPENVHGYDIYWPWPDAPTRACICPILDAIASCFCFNKTAYDVKIQIINNGTRLLCWMNLNPKMNNTKLVLREAYPIDFCGDQREAHTFRQFVQIIVKAYADPSTPTIYTEGYKICFNSTFDTRAPVTHYHITAHNSLGEQTLMTNITGEQNCTSPIPHFFQSLCGPFHIEAIAYTQFSQSATPGLLDIGLGNNSNCSCAREKVKAELIPHLSTNGTLIIVEISLKCVTSITGISIQATAEKPSNCSKQIIPVEFTTNECNTTLKRYFSDLCGGTKYRFVTNWGLTNSMCNVSKVTEYTTPNPTTNSTVPIIVVLIVLVVIITVIIIVLGISCKNLRKKRCNNKSKSDVSVSGVTYKSTAETVTVKSKY